MERGSLEKTESAVSRDDGGSHRATVGLGSDTSLEQE